MNKLKGVLGYIWAALTILMVFVLIFGYSDWQKILPEATGLRVSPWMVGGKVVYTVQKGAYQVDIRETVFQALIGEYDKGFVQVDFTPLKALPAVIDEDVDYNQDGKADFHIRWDTAPGAKAEITPLAPAVLGLEGQYRLKESLVLRVSLKNIR